MARKLALTALVYALIGLLLGIYMAASQNHVQMVTHAHILLIGFVISFIYSAFYKLWNLPGDGRSSQLQFYAHQAGTLVLTGSLFLMYGQFVAPAVLEPIMAVASIAVLLGMVTMAIVFVRHTRVVRADPGVTA